MISGFLRWLFRPGQLSHSNDEEPSESFYSKVAGVTFSNDDGANRQKILSKCSDGEVLLLEHRPIRGHPDAVAVCRQSGKQLGYLNSDVAEQIAPLLDDGVQVDCEISEITGGTKGKSTLGCNIRIIIWE